MELNIDTGVEEFRVNGRGVLRFNPADPNLYHRFFAAGAELDGYDAALTKALAALDIFYPDFLTIPGEQLREAAEKMLWFINCGDEGGNRKRPKLMDWEQDFQYIAAPINRVVGQEIRAMPYLHWWTFISAYYEIGDCFFAQIVRIRSLRAKGKRLEKADQEFYRENKRLVDIKEKYSEAENTLLQEWI